MAVGERQQEQIRSFLDLARHRLTEPGEWQHVEMGDVVRRVVDDLAPIIEDHGAVFEIGDLDREYLPVNLVAHVWRNLIGNAVRHQTSSEPKVWIGQIREGGTTSYYVEDNGSQPEKLIEAVKGAEPVRSEAASTSLGLEICRRILRVLGGTLRAERSASRGAKVLFTLPKVDALNL